MKLIDILTDMNPILRILLVIVLAVAAHFTVKTIRRLSQYFLTMKVDSKDTSTDILTRGYPKLATIGLRFTVLINLHGQRIIIPNRNIATISQFRDGCIRAYVDVQLPQAIDEPDRVPASILTS